MDAELLTVYPGGGCWCCGAQYRSRLFIRKLEGKLYGRFAILPNIPGHQYTIGSVYPGQKENDEFIYSDSIGVAPIHCRIKVDDAGEYWISAEKKGRRFVRTFVNGEALKGEPKKLTFGDTVSLSVAKNIQDDGVARSGYDVFLIKEREVRTDVILTDPRMNYPIFDHERDMYEREQWSRQPYSNQGDEDSIKENIRSMIPCRFIPGENSLILSHILNYLSIGDLMRYRLVSRAWNDEAAKVLRKKSAVAFNFQIGYKETLESMRIFRFEREMKTFNPSNIKIVLQAVDEIRWLSQDENSQDHNLAEKFVNDFDSFLNLQTNIKSLDFTGKIITDRDYNIWQKLFQKVAPGLEALCFDGKIKQNYATTRPSFPCPNFPALRKLVVKRLSTHSKDVGDLGPWVEEMSTAVSRIKTLEFNLRCCIPIPGYLDDTDVHGLLPDMLLHRICSQRMPYLSEVYLFPVRPQQVKSLLQLQLPLQVLSIKDQEIVKTRNGGTELVSSLQDLLMKHAKSLTKLRFSLEDCTFPFRLPKFPKLQVLNFKFSVGSQIVSDTSEVMIYAEQFPVLQELDVSSTRQKSYWYLDAKTSMQEWELNPQVFGFFFPRDSEQVCRTIKKLVIPHSVNGFVNNPTAYNDRIVEVSRMFPNVKNEWLDEARRASNKRRKRPPPTPMTLRSAGMNLRSALKRGKNQSQFKAPVKTTQTVRRRSDRKKK